MSRVSIERRMERARDVLLPPGSLEWRIDRLPDDLKRAHRTWSERCAAITSASEKRGYNIYELLLAGDDITPPMPFAVHHALWPDDEQRVRITADMSVKEAAEVWQAMLDEGKAR